MCGVVTCSKTTEASRANNDTTSSTVVFDTILSMSLFKKVSDVAITRDVLVASVTPQEPRLIRVANGMKVVGSLDAVRATVRVELVKLGDCQSEFTCHVRGLDSQGREAVSTASLVKQPRHRENQVNDGKMMSSLSLQLLASVQQLVSQSVAGLEDKTERISDQKKSLENKVNGRTDTLEKNLNDQMGQLLKDFRDKSDTFEHRIDNKLDIFENRIEDKLDNNNNLNKLIHLDFKVSTYLDQFRSQAKTDIVDALENLKQEIQ
ncbi:hypothetical protein ElyMa_006442700 [Elysia marginata]|uniref:Uncharacterized protein n=1 Tax=Elysia marginata TaxID=1093978 RepID=A0AAV4HVV0_9GAST|nr:hypothetical protein ElyMa_006442700 [Elysia marginata]